MNRFSEKEDKACHDFIDMFDSELKEINYFIDDANIKKARGMHLGFSESQVVGYDYKFRNFGKFFDYLLHYLFKKNYIARVVPGFSLDMLVAYVVVVDFPVSISLGKEG